MEKYCKLSYEQSLFYILGYLLLLLVFLCICGAVFALSYPFVMNEVLKFVKGGGYVLPYIHT